MKVSGLVSDEGSIVSKIIELESKNKIEVEYVQVKIDRQWRCNNKQRFNNGVRMW